MAAKPMSYYLAPVLLVLSTMLAAVNWYLQPLRAVAWASAIGVLACMALIFFLVSRRHGNEAAGLRAEAAITDAIVFAGVILAITLSVKLATTLGVINDTDLSRRMTMVVMGIFIAFTGNSVPKTLTPLSALQCDPDKVQAFQRLAAWMWVLTGLAYAIVWLVLPIALAKPVSIAVMMSGMLVIVTQIVRLRSTRSAH